MKKYIIRNVDEKFYNAASKARRDADTIAGECGYEPVPFSDVVTADGSLLLQVRMAFSCIVNGLKLLKKVEKGSLILLQHPQFPVKSSYFLRVLIPLGRRLKGLRFAALIHDLDSLRGLCGRTGVFCDRKLLPSLDAVICHNGAMKRFLMKLGIAEKRIVTLGIFDYLTEEKTAPHQLHDGIAVAGNLDPEKCAYIDGLASLLKERDEAGSGMPIHLYGKGREHFPEGITYHGALPPEELPGVIEGAFGLVWDGNETDRCGGSSGEYLRYNNPHKLSLYLASGMPVIVWKEAAVAEMVEKYGLGAAVGSLSEIRSVLNAANADVYEELTGNVAKFTGKIRKGYFLRRALRRIEQIIEQ